jgi:hypothetical protein
MMLPNFVAGDRIFEVDLAVNISQGAGNTV